MDTKKMCELATYIEDKLVDMSTFQPHQITVSSSGECGTACCIAGWLVIKERYDAPDIDSVVLYATRSLSLTEKRANYLFSPIGIHDELDQETQRTRMMGVLRGEIALTIDWLRNPQPRVQNEENRV